MGVEHLVLSENPRVDFWLLQKGDPPPWDVGPHFSSVARRYGGVCIWAETKRTRATIYVARYRPLRKQFGKMDSAITGEEIDELHDALRGNGQIGDWFGSELTIYDVPIVNIATVVDTLKEVLTNEPGGAKEQHGQQ